MRRRSSAGCGLAAVLVLSVGRHAAGADNAPAGVPAFDAWTRTGGAFGVVSADDQLRRLEITNAGGPVLSSESEGDTPRGTATSPPFMIARRFIAFRVGGGADERRTCVDLIVDAKVVRSTTGWRSDHLTPASWDVSQWAGKRAQIRVVDDSGGDWGHVNVSRVEQTDTPEQRPPATAPLYREALRPQFHFTARQWTSERLNPGQREEGWVNDLNGLIYYDGEYHLFAQRWAKCWLHAVSRDLVHWTELPPAFWEEDGGTGVQSGTVVVDYDNTSGLSPDKSKPAMVAFWSRFDNKSQCVSYSLDHGRTWTHYAKNPVFERAERDPKVFWYAPGKHWVMMMYGNDAYHILTSTDLLQWKDEHHPIVDSFECPDFFRLPVDGDASKTKWVLIQGNGRYSVGTFDGRRFTEETERRSCDAGDFYATQSWHNTDSPGGDGRRVQAAWMRFSDFPDMPFSQQISFPCELTLRTTPGGLRLFRNPVRAIESLHAGRQTWTPGTLRDGQTLPLAAAGGQFRLLAKVTIPDDAKLVFDVRGTNVVLGPSRVDVGDRHAGVTGRVRTVEMLIDTASVETFLNDGEASLTRATLPRGSGLRVRAEGGTATVDSIELFPLKSAWPAAE